MADTKTANIAGATGYIGHRLCAALLQRGHTVIALTRPGSQGKLPPDCHVVLGNALDADSYAAQVPPGCVFVHLVGGGASQPSQSATIYRHRPGVRARFFKRCQPGQHIYEVEEIRSSPLIQ